MARIVNTETRHALAWRVVNIAARRAEIDLFDVIGDPWDGTTAKQFIDELRALEVDEIDLNINSPGGYVDDALGIYDALLRHPATITAHIVVAASAASFVAQAADTRLISKNGKVFIHDAQGIGIGNSSDLRTLAELLDAESDNIASIYAERAGGTVTEWRDRMRADGFGSTYRGQEAVEVKLVDAVEAVPSRNLIPGRVAAHEPIAPPTDAPELGLSIDLIPPMANGYRPPVPDFTRLLAANMPRKEG